MEFLAGIPTLALSKSGLGYNLSLAFTRHPVLVCQQMYRFNRNSRLLFSEKYQLLSAENSVETFFLALLLVGNSMIISKVSTWFSIFIL